MLLMDDDVVGECCTVEYFEVGEVSLVFGLHLCNMHFIADSLFRGIVL